MLKLADKIPGLTNIGPIKSYVEYVEQGGFKVDPVLWVIMCGVVSLVISLMSFLILPDYWQISVILFVFIADISIAYPYMNGLRRVEEIEENLPDALRQMSDTLKAGGTYEYAIREIASSEYGALKIEMDNVLRKLEEGENFETALGSLSNRVKSRLIERTVTIIIDSVRAGAGLADILEQIAEDVRATHRINRERRASTLMQVIFMVAAGGFAAPMIFGFVKTIIEFLLTVAPTSEAFTVTMAETCFMFWCLTAAEWIVFGVELYIFIEVSAVALMVALMRTGKIGKSLLYFPVVLLMAYVVYFTAESASAFMIGGV